jgi:hypothetical protein
MIRLVRTRRLRALEQELRQLQDQKLQFVAATLRLRSEKDLVSQARDHFAGLADYWRVRCERFMDQIGASSGIISAPTMTDPAPASTDDVRTVFAALGRSELTATESPAPVAATSAPAPVTGVDPAVAQRAIAEVLASVSTT